MDTDDVLLTGPLALETVGAHLVSPSGDVEVRQLPRLTVERVVLKRSHRRYLAARALLEDDGSGRSDVSNVLAGIIAEHLARAAANERTRSFAIALPRAAA